MKHCFNILFLMKWLNPIPCELDDSEYSICLSVEIFWHNLKWRLSYLLTVGRFVYENLVDLNVATWSLFLVATWSFSLSVLWSFFLVATWSFSVSLFGRFPSWYSVDFRVTIWMFSYQFLFIFRVTIWPFSVSLYF